MVGACRGDKECEQRQGWALVEEGHLLNKKDIKISAPRHKIIRQKKYRVKILLLSSLFKEMRLDVVQ